MSLPILLLISLALVAVVCALYRSRSRRPAPYPPAPPALPFIGNYFSLPTYRPWETYAKWSVELRSDVISVCALGQLTVVLNSKKAAKALLERRSAIYSDRPTTTMIKLMGWDFNLAFFPYSDAWRVRRRILHDHFRAKAVLAYQPVIRAKIRGFLRGVSREPAQFERHLSAAAGAIAMAITYGQGGGGPEDDAFIRTTEEAMSMLSCSVIPGATAVNIFPFLQHLPGWLPGMGFKAFAQRCTVLTTRIKNTPWEAVKKGVAERTAGPSMASTLITEMQATSAGKDHEAAAVDACAITYAGQCGVDTTGSAVSSAILALLLNPAVLRRAQREIDEVVGRERLPDIQDRPAMPYSEALYREVLRWIPVGPLAGPHAALEDDVYEGYFIPKGTQVIANTWAMFHNPEEYPDPQAFRPERHFPPDGQLTDDDMRYAYGYGRRICAGLHLAETQVWQLIVALCAVFDVVHSKDENGIEVPVVVGYTDGMISHPLPFECVLQPRDQEVKALLQKLNDED